MTHDNDMDYGNKKPMIMRQNMKMIRMMQMKYNDNDETDEYNENDASAENGANDENEEHDAK